MNIQEYISSGIIESYVLGLASPEERVEFEKMCALHPELIEARTNFELSIEKQAFQNSIPPPTGSKEKTWLAIQQSATKNTSKIISMEPGKNRLAGLRWFAAASVILFLLTAYLAYSFYNKNRELQAKVDRSDSLINRMTEGQKIMHDPNVMVVNMVGLKGSSSSVNVYWDSTSTDVYMVVKNMPKLPSDKQYQLWALIGSKPVDLGLFDVPQSNVILKMKNTQNADAFAITIEDRGHTGGPDLEQLQAMGKAKL
ncbi:MAG TPA: anti-sigma factor [Chitinophagaceae bacterium]|nr:anti-sigma factor [Chitinophagaceae bacterium]